MIDRTRNYSLSSQQYYKVAADDTVPTTNNHDAESFQSDDMLHLHHQHNSSFVVEGGQNLNGNKMPGQNPFAESNSNFFKNKNNSSSVIDYGMGQSYKEQLKSI